MKQFIGLARVSSYEQEREGFSLDVQEAAMLDFARKENGVIDRIFRIAETATKTGQRKTFREMIAYAKRYAEKLDGILFYKVDRAARNMKDFVLLEELESDYGLPFISITQPVQNTPTGRMIRRTLATMAAFQTEQQSVDIRDALAKRVAMGWFPSRCPYGYRNVRRQGRAIAETHPQHSPKVVRIFHLRAYGGMLIEEIVEQLCQEGLAYSPSKSRFSPSKVYAILHDQSYIGFVKYRGEWHPGLHEALIDRTTWDRVRVSFGQQTYRSHEMVYASQLISCGLCGHPITGEEKEKQTRNGMKSYVYYRCARYHHSDHARVRIREQEFDAQVIEMLSRFQVESAELRQWMVIVASARLDAERASYSIRGEEVRRQLSLVDGQREELLNLRLAKNISDERYAIKQKELEERALLLHRQIEMVQQLQAVSQEVASRAADVFESIRQDWVALERPVKHRLLRLLFGGFSLDGTRLVKTERTPLELFSVE